MKMLIVAVFASVAFAGYTLNEAISTIAEFKHYQIDQVDDSQVIYGHRIGPAGQEMILTTR